MAGWGFIDSTGATIIEPRYPEVSDFSDGLAPVLVAGTRLWGYVDRAGNMAIAPQFTGAGTFQDGLAAVTPKKK